MEEEERKEEEQRNEVREGYRSGEFVFRSAEGEAGTIEGRMAPYNVWARIDSFVEGQFYERFMPGSLRKTLTERAHKLRVLFEHGLDRTIGNMPIAQIDDLREEEDGVHYRASLVEGLPAYFMDGLRRGLYGSSVRHKPLDWDSEPWPKRSDYNPEGWEERSVKESMAKEFSVVTFPAYEGATAVMRSLTDDIWKETHGARALEHPELLLQQLRAQADETHSEPPEESGKASRDAQPKPQKDWLSTEEVSPSWRIP